MATKYRAIVARTCLPRSRSCSARLAASARAPPLKDRSRSVNGRPNRSRKLCTQGGASVSTTKKKNVKASKLAERRAWIFVTRLSAAAIKQAPTKYAQNRCHGIHRGTIEAMAFVSVKCSVPKAASGAAEKSGPNKTNLSNPRAFCQSARRKVVTSPMARATPKARYDQITVLGIARKAMTADEFSKLPLMTIPFRPVVLPQYHVRET